MSISTLLSNETARQAAFPVTRDWAYFGHAGVAPITQAAVDAMADFAEQGSRGCQENDWTEERMEHARGQAARLIGADAKEIALIGPTTLGINLVAQGIDWQPGDEVVFYQDDYPANVYAWLDLERRDVKPVAVVPDRMGELTWEVIERALTDKTRLVALASCHFLTGFRPDVEGIGEKLHERGILLSLDAIQTLGAWSLDVKHVDFLSADSHKWMLGPVGAGIFYVKREHQDMLRPSILGSWNVTSPGFVAQKDIQFNAGARRYEAGTFNIPGTVGMGASLDVLLDTGIDAISERLLALRGMLLDGLGGLGFSHVLAESDLAQSPDHASGIITVRHATREPKPFFEALQKNGVFPSMRGNRSGEMFLRFSPHFYTSDADVARVIDVLKKEV